MLLVKSNKRTMSNGFFRALCYFLLIVIEFLLNIVYSVSNCVFLIAIFCLRKLLNENMIESPKKRKRNQSEKNNQVTATRGVIDANWQKLLSSNLLMDKKTEKPAQEDQKQHYTGTFRRARKKKAKNDTISNTVQNDMKTLNLDTVANNLESNKQNFVKTNTTVNKNTNNKVKNNENNQKNKLTKFIAMDCEMVGIGYDGNDHMLARVSLVNKFGDCIYDKFVKAREEVIDYRTDISGVRREDMLNGEEFSQVQKDVADIIKGRILVGHSLKNDLSVLFLSHPKRNIRDTSRYKPFRKITKGSTPSLKRLAKEILGIDIQHGEHSSVEDARAAMQLYCTVAKKWEATLSEKRGYNRKLLDES